MTFKATCEERGDCTASYDVLLDKEYTVQELIDEILTQKDEWGIIGIGNEWTHFAQNCEYCCKYDHGKLLSFLPARLLDKPINKVEADGGWSLMNYCITLKGKENIC